MMALKSEKPLLVGWGLQPTQTRLVQPHGCSTTARTCPPLLAQSCSVCEWGENLALLPHYCEGGVHFINPDALHHLVRAQFFHTARGLLEFLVDSLKGHDLLEDGLVGQ